MAKDIIMPALGMAQETGLLVQWFKAEGEQVADLRLPASVAAIANLLMAVSEGRMSQFSRSGFEHPPLESWEQQWQVLRAGLFSRTGN